jgi:hypothetical protein
MKAATHNGTCQVCLRMQALPNGKLAKHGYTVEHHYFEGVCPGAEALPLEQSREVADDVVRGLRNRAAAATARAEALKAGTLRPAYAKSGRRIPVTNASGRTRMEDEMIAFTDAPELNQRDAVTVAIWNNESDAKGATRYADAIEAAADKITGKQALALRAKKERTPITVGTVVRVYGEERAVLRIEDKVARGIGPYLNGQVMPHVIVANRDGTSTWAYPVRLIRESSIVKAA